MNNKMQLVQNVKVAKSVYYGGSTVALNRSNEVQRKPRIKKNLLLTSLDGRMKEEKQKSMDMRAAPAVSAANFIVIKRKEKPEQKGMVVYAFRTSNGQYTLPTEI